MARIPLDHPATYADLLAVPDHLVAEIVDGELHTSPRPAPRHARAGGVLHGELHSPFDRGRGGPGGWTLLFEPELHFGRDVLVPDIAGWRRERLQRLPDAAYFTLSPDWLCEVVSPSTSKLDRLKKLPIYARQEIEHVWLVDPLRRTIEVLRRERETWSSVTVAGEHQVVRLPPFDAIEIELRYLWNLEREGEAAR